MTTPSSGHSTPLQDLETDVALRAILEGTATQTGQHFFASLVQNLAKVLGTHGAWVTEYFSEERRLRALAFWLDGQWVPDYAVGIVGSPCEVWRPIGIGLVLVMVFLVLTQEQYGAITLAFLGVLPGLLGAFSQVLTAPKKEKLEAASSA